MPSLFKEIVCQDCSHVMPANPMILACEKCGSTWLEARYDYDATKSVWQQGLNDRDASLWRYEELLPVANPSYVTSMGEGWTPLVRAYNLQKELKLNYLFMKDERQGPTGSFKDRQAVLGVTALHNANITECVLASTGNKAAAYAAYCARAGIRLWIFLTSLVPNEKLRELGLYGAEVIKIAGTYDQAKKVANDFAVRRNLHLERGADSMPSVEGMKTIAFEIAEQLARQLPQDSQGKWRAPDWYIQAVSGGIGPIAIWKGFKELHQMGMIDKMPKLGIIQVEGCAPMVDGWQRDLEEAETVIPRTRIAVLATGSPGRGYKFLRAACKSNGGTMVAVNDGQAFRAMRRLARVEGYSMEPATSVAFAGLEKMVMENIIQPDEVVVVNCSGHTFPAEKHVLEDQYVLDLQLGQEQGAEIIAHPTQIEEGLGAALERLDEQVTTVVVIDDNPQDSRLIRRLLQNHKNYRVFEANNPLDGLDLVKQRKPDLVVTDLTMPEMDGFTLLETLKSDPETRDIPVVVISAKTLTPHDLSALEGRAESLWQKGNFNTRELVDYVVKKLGAEDEGLDPSKLVEATVEQVAKEVKTILETVNQTKILVIDDNRRDARLVRRILEATKEYQVFEAFTHQEAEDFLQSNVVGLIVLDLMFPEGDGIDLLKKLRQDSQHQQTPIVILTAKDLSAAEKALLEAHQCTLWFKASLDRQALIDHVKKIVGNK